MDTLIAILSANNLTCAFRKDSVARICEELFIRHQHESATKKAIECFLEAHKTNKRSPLISMGTRPIIEITKR